MTIQVSLKTQPLETTYILSTILIPETAKYIVQDNLQTCSYNIHEKRLFFGKILSVYFKKLARRN